MHRRAFDRWVNLRDHSFVSIVETKIWIQEEKQRLAMFHPMAYPTFCSHETNRRRMSREKTPRCLTERYERVDQFLNLLGITDVSCTSQQKYNRPTKHRLEGSNESSRSTSESMRKTHLDTNIAKHRVELLALGTTRWRPKRRRSIGRFALLRYFYFVRVNPKWNAERTSQTEIG